jgi:hypothetical protein
MNKTGFATSKLSIAAVALINIALAAPLTHAAPASKTAAVSSASSKALSSTSKSSAQAATLPSSSEAWRFMAFAAPYGRFKAVTTADTTLVDNGVFHYSIHGPDFDVFKVLNPENKTYIQTTVSAYSTQWAPSVKYPPLKKIGTGKMLGLDCVHYSGQTFRPSTIIDAWYTDAIPMKKGLADSFSKVCGLPVGYGVPVKVQFIPANGKMLMFELLSLTKTRVVAETLLVPKNYRYMKDQALFFLSDEDGSNSGIDEFMRWKPTRSAPAKDKPKN